jgi:serine/threonine protein kinase
MGSVYLAEHVSMRRQVALKILPRDLVNDKSYLERFQREARVAASLDHPNIVRAYDFDHADDLYYLVLEFVDGQDMAALVRSQGRPLAVGQAGDYICQAAAGLAHAHAKGIIHRDIKPSNLLVNREDSVKILDLGLARYTSGEASSVTEIHSETVLGTADYLSPEQALNSRGVDFRADIYSLGCTLYFSLVGHAPFAEGTLAHRIAQHQSAEPQPLRKLRPEVPEDLVEACRRMMRKKPSDRYESAREVESALAKCRSVTEYRLQREARTAARTVDRRAQPGPIRHGIPPHGGFDGSGGAQPGFSPHPDRPAGSFDPAEIGIETSESDSSIRTRMNRPARVKRPPILLWIVLAIMLVVVTVLATMVLLL